MEAWIIYTSQYEHWGPQNISMPWLYWNLTIHKLLLIPSARKCKTIFNCSKSNCKMLTYIRNSVIIERKQTSSSTLHWLSYCTSPPVMPGLVIPSTVQRPNFFGLMGPISLFHFWGILHLTPYLNFWIVLHDRLITSFYGNHNACSSSNAFSLSRKACFDVIRDRKSVV